MSATKDRQATVTSAWSKKYSKTLYRVKVEGFSTALQFNESELAELRNQIDRALGGKLDRNHQ